MNDDVTTASEPKNTNPLHSLRDVFLAAAELDDPAARARYLTEACGSDAALRQRVEMLLAAEAKAGPFTETGSTARVAYEHALGERIDRYKLLQKIGEGGCGVVYMAEQSEPVKRRVALKVIKLGMDTKSVIARFEAERQALALMDHPNIAKVLDGGATDAGRPYFVMELVRGTKITEYCDQHSLSTHQRLDLFVKVCQAIQHAHQKGIIHRDIKPSNILVTLHDGVAVPKVIDFGIAKATTDQRLTDKTLFTALEQFIGTPAYMSPEQAEMSGLDIDTRCDIYSLGVLLYEMLTGKTPFDAKELLASGLDEMRRTIREKEPARPSTRLSTMLEGELTTTAKHRQSDAPKLVNLLRGDLDWIVMKCLEKDRARRYETANGLASDIQRHLSNEAVLARPPSAAYRFQKLVRRNKLAFAAGTAITSVLVLGVIVSTWLAVRATRAKLEAVEQRQSADKSAQEARQAEQKAETQRTAAVAQRKLADMQLALQAWEEGDLPRAKNLIEDSRPEPGQAPAFEWRYLKNLCRDESLETYSHHQYRSAQFFGHDAILFNEEKTLTVQDVTKRTNYVLLEDQDGIWRPTFCAGNTNLLATVTDDSRIKVWDLRAKRVQVELEGASINKDFSSPIAFSHDGRWLASASQDKSIKLWDISAREPEARTIYPYSNRVFSVVFSPDNKQLFSSGSESRIRIWDVATGSEAAAPLQGHTSSCYVLATSRDGRWLASGSSDATVILWDLISRKRAAKLSGHSGGIQALSFSPDSRSLASGGWDQIVRLWDLNKEDPRVLLRGHGEKVRWVSFSPDGQSLLSGSWDGLIKRWHATPGLTGNVLSGSPECLNHVALSPDRRLLASVSDESFAVNLWDRSTRSPTVLTGHSNSVMRAAFSPDGTILATASFDQTVKLWDVGGRKSVATLTNGFPAGSLAFSPDGRTLIVGGSFLHMTVGGLAGLQFWDVPSRRATGTIPGDSSDIVEVAWSRDGTLLATAHRDGDVSLWETQTRRRLHRFKSHSVISLAFSPTEPLLVAGDWQGNIAFYNTATMAEVGSPLKAHTSGAGSLSFTPDGRTLASYGDGGGGVKLWQVATRQVALTLKGHVGPVLGIVFSQDGNLMASCGADSTVRLWPAATLKAAEAPAKTKLENP